MNDKDKKFYLVITIPHISSPGSFSYYYTTPKLTW